jgi:uncharacterized membrane protein
MSAHVTDLNSRNQRLLWVLLGVVAALIVASLLVGIRW